MSYDNELKLIYYGELARHSLQIDSFNRAVNEAIADLVILSEDDVLMDYLAAENRSSFGRVSRQFSRLLMTRGLYRNLVYVDSSGTRLLEIRNRQDSMLIEDFTEVRVEDACFREVLSLNFRDIYISQINPAESCSGKTEPPGLVLRIGIPVFSTAGEKHGVLILTLLADKVLDRFDLSSGLDYLTEYVLDNDGNWLKSSNLKNDEQLFSGNFSKKYPDEWKEVNRRGTGAVETANGLFLFTKADISTNIPDVYLYSVDTERYVRHYYFRSWYFVSRVDKAGIVWQVVKADLSFIIFVPVFTLVALIFLYLIFRKENLTQKMLASSESRLRIENETKKKLMSIIAHDLRNPVSTFISGLKLMEMARADDNHERVDLLVDELTESALRMKRLLENLLFWARSQQDNIELCPSGVIIRELVEEEVNLARASLRQKKIVVENSIEEHLVGWTDETLLSIAVRNLLSNAIKFTESGGNIRFRAERLTSGSRIRLSVCDSGKGMSPETIHKIMKESEFYSTPGTMEEKGSGLGLKLCMSFAKRSGSTLEIVSEEGKGSCFSFTLPEKTPEIDPC